MLEPPRQRAFRSSWYLPHLDGVLLVRALLGGQVCGAKGALAEDGARLVVLPAVGIGIVGQDPVSGNLAIDLSKG